MSLVDTFYAANFTLNRLAVIIRIECWRFVVYLQEKFVSVRFVFFVCVIAKIERNIFGIFYFFVQHKNTVQVRSSIIHVMLLETFYLHSLKEGNKFENSRAPQNYSIEIERDLFRSLEMCIYALIRDASLAVASLKSSATT